MGQPAARFTDMHVCPMVTGVVPHVGGPIIPPCAITVLTGFLPQARVGDMAICVGPLDSIAKGSATVIVSGMPAARMGDLMMHGGTIVKGEPTVLIGDSVGSGGGGGSEMRMAKSGPGGQANDPTAQSKAMIKAAKEGQPFCEICNRS